MALDRTADMKTLQLMLEDIGLVDTDKQAAAMSAVDGLYDFATGRKTEPADATRKFVLDFLKSLQAGGVDTGAIVDAAIAEVIKRLGTP